MAKTRALDSTLGELHLQMAQHLLAKVKSGEASAQELAAAIKFLKDNNITSAVDAGTPLADLRDTFPIFNDNEDEYA
jgi:hypothetical protein